MNTYEACKFAATADQSMVCHNLLATPADLAATPHFSTLRLLHPIVRQRTGSRIFEWLKVILVGILVGHNMPQPGLKSGEMMSNHVSRVHQNAS